jgi:hypothetical protein
MAVLVITKKFASIASGQCVAGSCTTKKDRA